jgi:hypothetical protein
MKYAIPHINCARTLIESAIIHLVNEKSGIYIKQISCFGIDTYFLGLIVAAS